MNETILHENESVEELLLGCSLALLRSPRFCFVYLWILHRIHKNTHVFLLLRSLSPRQASCFPLYSPPRGFTFSLFTLLTFYYRQEHHSHVNFFKEKKMQLLSDPSFPARAFLQCAKNCGNRYGIQQTLIKSKNNYHNVFRNKKMHKKNSPVGKVHKSKFTCQVTQSGFKIAKSVKLHSHRIAHGALREALQLRN